MPCLLCRILFESAEKLEAVSAVREYENLQLSEGQQPVMGLLQMVIYGAGQQFSPQVGFRSWCAPYHNSCDSR